MPGGLLPRRSPKPHYNACNAPAGLTRTQRHRYLIGDWDFIHRPRSPGTLALASLDGEPGVRVIDAARVL